MVTQYTKDIRENILSGWYSLFYINRFRNLEGTVSYSLCVFLLFDVNLQSYSFFLFYLRVNIFIFITIAFFGLLFALSLHLYTYIRSPLLISLHSLILTSFFFSSFFFWISGFINSFIRLFFLNFFHSPFSIYCLHATSSIQFQ